MVYLALIEKGIGIENPYTFELPFGNSDFVTIWVEFDLLVRIIVQCKWFLKIFSHKILFSIFITMISGLLGQTVESEFILTLKFINEIIS